MIVSSTEPGTSPLAAPDTQPTNAHPNISLEYALERIAGSAAALDANPRFPSENFECLREAGILQLAADRERCDLALEIELVRAVAQADASTARILDGHFNGVERLALGLQGELRVHELEEIAQGALMVGVWGADPAPGEGPPAKIEHLAKLERGGEPQLLNGVETFLNGVKTFCSGAGGIQRALVVARDESGGRRLVYADLSVGVHIDRSWYRASGLRSSESHRVEFCDTPVLAVLGEQDELMREPWLSRDAVRTSTTWAGIADCIVLATVNALAGRPTDDLRLHALGKMRVAQASIDRWLEHCASSLQSTDDPILAESYHSLAGECRIALADAARLIAAEAARICGSRALAGGGTLDRARRDLDLFLLQHRLDPKLVELGARTLEESPR